MTDDDLTAIEQRAQAPLVSYSQSFATFAAALTQAQRDNLALITEVRRLRQVVTEGTCYIEVSTQCPRCQHTAEHVVLSSVPRYMGSLRASPEPQ